MAGKIIPLFALPVLLFAAKTNAQIKYDFPKPKGWNTEKLTMPISFAKSIPFKGAEELRFTPGWSNSQSEEYWAYDFLWYVNGLPVIKKSDLDKYMADYYNGLYLTNSKNKPQPTTNFSKAHFKKVDAQINDKLTFEGRISTLDYLTGLPVKFNARVHVRYDASAQQHTAILFEVSPQSYKNVIWDSLDGVANGFRLNK